MTSDEQILQSERVLNYAEPVDYGAVEFACAMRVLDDLKIPRTHNGNTLTIVGRIHLLAAKNLEDE